MVSEGAVPQSGPNPTTPTLKSTICLLHILQGQTLEVVQIPKKYQDIFQYGL